MASVKMSESVLRLYRELGDFRWLKSVEFSWKVLQDEGFVLSVIARDGGFAEYVDYVFENESLLVPERNYVENCLFKGKSWGEILVIKKNDKIVASFGPNRIEKDDKGVNRAKPGYFSVLPKYRSRKIGTVLWFHGLDRMSKAKADYIRCSVERDNFSALKIYLKSGMKADYLGSKSGKAGSSQQRVESADDKAI